MPVPHERRRIATPERSGLAATFPRSSHPGNFARAILIDHGLGQAEGLPRRRRSGQLHPCGRAARTVAIGGFAPSERVGAGTHGVPVPSPCARAHPHRAGRVALSHRPRRVHEAGIGARQADRQPRAPERRPQDHHHGGDRRALAHAAARRVRRPLSRHPHHPDHHRRGARPRDARGGRGDPPAPADPARPDPAQAVLGALPRLCLAGIPQALRHAARP